MSKRDLNKNFVPVFKREGAPFVKGKGAYLYDTDDNKYLDFGTGIAVSALGHSHPTLVKTIKKQGGMLLHTSNLYFNKPQVDLADELVKKSFGEKIFFCNSGTEANEAAIKIARKWAKTIDANKYHILSFNDGFHGRTYGALSATAQAKFHKGFEPICEGFHYANFNDIKGTEKILKKYNFAAIFVEPVQGESGVHAASKEFLTFLRKYADDNSILLVFDEIQCGMGRTGTLWAYEKSKIIPDIMTLAKPLGGGLPLGAVICKETVANIMAPGDHGTTFGGNPLACALGLDVLNIVSDKAFLKKVKSHSAYLSAKLQALQTSYPIIKEIRSEGLLIGVELHNDPLPVIAKCRQEGLLLVKAGHHTIRFLPPLNVKCKEIEKAVDIFENVIKETIQ
jgi:predicted acetylornithine/succinylornithine family transaminase